MLALTRIRASHVSQSKFTRLKRLYYILIAESKRWKNILSILKKRVHLDRSKPMYLFIIRVYNFKLTPGVQPKR